MRLPCQGYRAGPVVALVLLAGLLADGGAFAQPSPPIRVYGEVAIDGQLAPPGTLVEAVVNGIVCGADRLVGNRYVIDVGCAIPGATVSFRIDGVPARESAVIAPGAFVPLDLSRGLIPPLDPDNPPARWVVLHPDTPARIEGVMEPEGAIVTVISHYTAGLTLAALYPPAPDGTATLYLIAGTDSTIMSRPDSQGRCNSITGYPHVIVCTVTAGAQVSFQGR